VSTQVAEGGVAAVARGDGTRPVARLGLRLAGFQGVRFVIGTVLWVSWWSAPALAGLVLQAIFDAISADASAALNVPTLAALLMAVEGTRLLIFSGALILWSRWWVSIETLLRTNLLRSQMASGGRDAGKPVTGAGSAIAVFRDDVEDLLIFVDSWLDLAGTAVFATVALAVMVRVDATLTLVVVLPLLAVFAITRSLSDRIRRTRRADREATARVTGFLGEVFSSVLAIKVAGAEEASVARLKRLNQTRRHTALRDRVLTETLEAFNGSTVDISIGLVLLLSAAAMRSGDFSVGDLALFASYVTSLAGLPRWAGLVLTRHRHAQVAAGRMAQLLPREDADEAVVHRPLGIEGLVHAQPRPRHDTPAPAAVRLEGFGVRQGGIEGIDLYLPPGSFTVVCGPVGSGKTTLLRALLGLAGPTTGTVCWDGEVVDDLAAHMIPPRCAYVPQVPRLLSASLRDNLTMGRATPGWLLDDIVGRAALQRDLADMADGLDTVIGPRGVRLSGGQLQRVAAARALAADPALLVLDDLSSALDAATERELWSRLLRDQHPTVLVVSQRAAALERADQIVLLNQGRVHQVDPGQALRGSKDALRSPTGR